MENKKGLKIMFAIALATLLIPFASAEITIQSQPNETYNLGDTLTIPTTITALQDKQGVFKYNLICQGKKLTFYQNGITLNQGEERKIKPSLLINKDLIGNTTGNCVIKGSFDNEKITTDQFKISDKINITLNLNKTSFEPNSTATFKGKAVRENGEKSNGLAEIEIKNNKNFSIKSSDKIEKGEFFFETKFPSDMAAEKYNVEVKAYEKNSKGEKTNTGSAKANIRIKQVPTSLEVILEDKEVSPKNQTKIKTRLHDQTGKKIIANSSIIVSNSESEIVKEKNIQTEKEIEVKIPYNSPPKEWTVLAESSGLSTKRTFEIKELKAINTTIAGNRLNITNAGNIAYNDSVEIKIGQNTTKVNVSIPVGGTESYRLTAPDGEYEVSVLGENGEPKVTKTTTLTGNAIGANQGERKRGSILSFSWIFAILVFGLMGFMLYRKTKGKTIFAKRPKKTKETQTKKPTPQTVQQQTKTGLNPKNKAEVSLSIRGDKQKTTAVCINLENLQEMEESKGYAEKTIQKIIDYAEKQKAYTYESHDNLFFLFVPSKTKTFKNEPTALDVARYAKKQIKEHNRLFKKKIEFGISINNGQAIFKEDQNVAKFMSMDKLVPFAKKVSTQSKSSKSEILISKEVSNNLKSKVKAEKFKNQEEVYHITQLKEHNSEDTQKFIRDFQERMKKEQKNQDNLHGK